MGSLATERNGALFHFSNKDHPAHGLNTDPMRISPGELQVIGLRKKIVINTNWHMYFQKSSN